MKNAFVIVTLSGLLAACASAPTPEAAPAVALGAQGSEEADIAQAPQVEPDEKLPNVALTGDLLYKLLKAELEVKEGQWQGPYVTLLAAAQQTRDPRLARRALEVALGARQNQQALAAATLWRELAPESDEAAQYYLSFMVMADQLGEAEKLFRQRLQDATPATRPLVMFQMQQHLARAKDRGAAAAVLARLLEPYAGTVEAHIVLAQDAFLRGLGDVAQREARAALAVKPDSELAMLTLAQVTPDQKQVAGAMQDFLARYPQAHEVRAAHARLLVGQKQFADARREFERILKESPDNLGTLYALGIVSMQLDDPRAAEQYFIRFIHVLETKPDEERDPGKVLMILSQLAEERGDLASARAWLEKVEDGDEPAAYFSAQLKRAQLMAKGGDVDGARTFLAALKPAEPSSQAQLVLTEGQLLRDAG
ncbi:MAG: tetratricopeptide repeat protein, partial [Gammaproteobacteria bacterium]